MISNSNKIKLIDIAKQIDLETNVDKVEEIINQLNELEKSEQTIFFFIKDLMINYLLLQVDASVLVSNIANLSEQQGKEVPEGVPLVLIPAGTQNFVRLWLPYLVKAMQGEEITFADVPDDGDDEDTKQPAGQAA